MSQCYFPGFATSANTCGRILAFVSHDINLTDKMQNGIDKPLKENELRETIFLISARK
jgi:hypothetical protein